MDAVKALQRIALRQAATPPTPPTPTSSTPPTTNPGNKSIPSQRPISSSPQPSPTPPPTLELRSEKGVDYSHLRDLLAKAAQTNSADAWKAADQETYRLIITTVGKDEGQWFEPEEMRNFDCEVLLAIDGLWVKYSNGHFGFKVQKEIYVKCGARLNGDYPGQKIWDEFGHRIGWKQAGDRWISHAEVIFNASSPTGHLPKLRSGLSAKGEISRPLLFFRIRVCEMLKLLEIYLKNGQWKEADEETYRLMIATVGKDEGQWFEPEELLNFDCKVLLAIDGLWVKYSKGHFGFSVQKEIYVKCSAKLDGKYPGNEIWVKFSTRVGWREYNSYVYSDKITFNTSSPRAHLPTVTRAAGGQGVFWWVGVGLFSRIETCKLSHQPSLEVF